MRLVMLSFSPPAPAAARAAPAAAEGGGPVGPRAAPAEEGAQLPDGHPQPPGRTGKAKAQLSRFLRRSQSHQCCQLE